MKTSFQTSTATTSTFKQRARPGLKLNTTQKTFGEENIVVTMNSNNSYVVQNHPCFTDQNEFSYTVQKKYNQIFFNSSIVPESSGDHSETGDFYFVAQKANGKEMQDKYKVRTSDRNDPTFFGVYDGHSTHVIAELLASKLDEYILENFRVKSDLDSAIKHGFSSIESEVISSLQDQKLRGGSTALCNILYNQKIYSANLGDSQSYVIRGREVISLSNSHDFLNEAERLYVEQKGGVLLKNRLEGELAISRSIGDVNFKEFMNSEPEIMVYDITEEDEYLILCSDGFWNGMSPSQCVEKIEEFRRSENYSTELKNLGHFLVDEAKANIKIKKDNMTLIIVDLKEFAPKNKKKVTTFSGFF